MTASMTTSAGSSPPVSDVVADRQLEVDERPDPLVDALVARADEDEMRRASRGRRRGPGVNDLAARVEQDHDRLGSPDGVDGRRDRLGAHDHPGAAAVRRVVDARCRPRPHSRRSWIRIVARPRSWIRPGMLSASGPRSSPGTASGRRSRGSSVGRRRGGVGRRRLRAGRPSAASRRRAAGPSRRGALGGGVGRRFGGSRSSASASTTISPRRGAKIADERADGRHVELAVRLAARRRRPRSRRRGRRPGPSPRSAPSRPRTVDADDLVPVDLAAGQLADGMRRSTRGRRRAGASAASRS